MPVLSKLNNIPIRIPAGDGWPAMDVFVNFRIVESSNVYMVGWDDADNLYVRYRQDGPTYVYPGVKRQRAVWLANSPSCGSYIHRVIKPNYKHVKLP